MPRASRPRQPKKPDDPGGKPRTGGNPRAGANVVQPGQHVSGKGGRIRVIDSTTGEVVKDFGPATPETKPPPSEPGPGDVPGIPDNAWIVDSFWQNNGSEPINYFTTTWVVPPEAGRR